MTDYGTIPAAVEEDGGSFFLGTFGTSKLSSLTQQSLAPKQIGALGSFAIFINAIIGPGLLSLPKVFDDAGALVPSALIVFGFGLSSLSTIARCETVALMPDNSNFERIVEFCDPALKFVGTRTYYVCHVMFYLAAMSMAIASIALVAETADIVIAKIFGRSYALTWHEGVKFVVWAIDNCEQQQKCKPFITGKQIAGSDPFFLTLGYTVTFGIIFPVSSTNRIAEGMTLQYASFLITSIAVPMLSGKSLFRAATSGSHLSLFLSGPKAMASSGVVLFNLMYGIFVSTWLCEKAQDVSVNKTVYRSSCVGAIATIIFGASVAASTRHVAADGLLDSVEQGEPLPFVSVALLFGFFVIASGIPICCIMARHNLVSSTIKLVDPATASCLCTFFPWTVAWLFYTTPPYRSLVNYSGLFVVSWLALWMPFFILLHAIHPPPLKDGRCDFMAYLSWFTSLLVAPPDDDIDTVLLPLPDALAPYARNIYAVLLLIVTTWIVGALSAYVVAFITFTGNVLVN